MGHVYRARDARLGRDVAIRSCRPPTSATEREARAAALIASRPTLGATYGIYSGFELCENRAVPGTEAYTDSEKHQYRRWDWHRPGSIVALVERMNAMRRATPALHGDWSLWFHDTDNTYLIAYSKRVPDLSNIVVAIVNLGPTHMQHGWVRLPAAEWRLDGPMYEVEDLLTGARYHWRGEWNNVRLDPVTARRMCCESDQPFEMAHRLGLPSRPRPRCAATIRAVEPSGPAAFGFAPRARRSRTISMWLCRTAPRVEEQALAPDEPDPRAPAAPQGPAARS
jgi:hypothetical protein